jgi:hypothetical protein
MIEQITAKLESSIVKAAPTALIATVKNATGWLPRLPGYKG